MARELLTSAGQGGLWRCACWARGAGCISCCVRYADGGGLTAAGRQCREAVQRQAAVLFEQKIKPLEVAQRLRVSRKAAYQWHRLWRDGGIEALVSRGPSGSRCRLSPRCLEKLAAYQSRDPCSALGGLSLLELDSARGGRVRPHDVFRDLLRSRLGDGGVQRVNGALVNAVAASSSPLVRLGRRPLRRAAPRPHGTLDGSPAPSPVHHPNRLAR